MLYYLQSNFRLKGKENMKNNLKKITCSALLLSTLLLSSCAGDGYSTFAVTGPYMTGKTAKNVYNAYLSEAPTTLNPTLSQNAQNVSHIANLLSTLVFNDNYGILRRSLAKTAERSSDYKRFTFEIRDDVPWVTHDGKIYEVKGQKQYVKAEDFVETAKIVLNSKNSSEIYYMYTLFVNNAWEYYCYTIMADFIAQSKPGYKELKGDYSAQAAKLTEMVKEYSGHEPDEPITADDITKIAKFERVGVKVEDGKLVYTLRQSAQFFPTMLTYTPYMPTNATFYKAAGEAKGYGTQKEKMLYCGPFLISEFTSNSVKYTKNPLYFDKDNVHIDKVNYTVVDASTSYKDMREAFDREDVDGFALNIKDETGWNMYIKGEDGTGTIQNPASDLVNSRELDDVDYTYHFNLNINRSTEKPSYQNATYWDNELKGQFTTDEEKVACIENTNKALKIKEVRKLILDAVDFNVYNDQFTVEDKNQYQMNTFTPRGYVYDEYGKDYIEYYYEAYANHKGLEGGAEEAKSLVGPQQISGVNFLEETAENAEFLAKYPWLSLKKLREDAISAVTQSFEDGSKLSLPVIVDYMGVGGVSTDNLLNEQMLVQSWNERANACTINANRVSDDLPLCSKAYPGTPEGHYPYFEMVHDKITSASTWSNASQNGYYTIGSFGWMGDYADPLTYVHCYYTTGEMSKMSGNTTTFDSYSLVDGVLTKAPDHMFKEYNKMVDDASEINTSNHERYEAFAECEYKLLNEMYIIKPTHMTTQGWAASVSRACGYENPTAHYGLADHSLVGIWILVDVPTGAERKAARDHQNELKEAALTAVGNNTIEPIYN